jgi:AraC-like DNA-binding protein
MDSAFAFCSHPGAALLFKHFWQTAGSPVYQVESILPKGEIELIFSFDGQAAYHRSGIPSGSTPRCFVNGMSNTTVRLHLPRLQTFFGVVLQPAAVKKLLSVPSGTFLNAIVDLELLDPGFTTLWHELADRPSFNERVCFMESWAPSRGVNLHQQELALSQFLYTPEEIMTVKALASTFCYSTRQLHRKVQELFGMSSEVLLRYKRYQSSLFRVHHTAQTLTSIAHDCGYYDQAHFNREFKEFTGLTPGEYRKQKSSLAGHLYQ